MVSVFGKMNNKKNKLRNNKMPKFYEKYSMKTMENKSEIQSLAENLKENEFGNVFTELKPNKIWLNLKLIKKNGGYIVSTENPVFKHSVSSEDPITALNLFIEEVKAQKNEYMRAYIHNDSYIMILLVDDEDKLLHDGEIYFSTVLFAEKFAKKHDICILDEVGDHSELL